MAGRPASSAARIAKRTSRRTVSGRPLTAISPPTKSETISQLEIDERTRHAGAGAPTDASSGVAKWELRHRYPSEEAVRPTVLDNVLRAAEGRAGAPYGLDSVVTWPRLYPLLDDKVAAVVDDQRTQLDVGVRFAACFLAAAVVTFGLLVAHGWWLVVPTLFGVLSYLAYRGSVVAADGYGRAVEAAYDRHHLDLRDALGVSRPASLPAELALNEQLMQLWRGKTDIDIEYNDRQWMAAINHCWSAARAVFWNPTGVAIPAGWCGTTG